MVYELFRSQELGCKMPYTEVTEIGAGGFGKVILVQDESGNRFAKKIFQPQNFQNVTLDELRKRFLREVKYQSAIDHPNVVKIVDEAVHDDPPCFYMELADGSLADFIKSSPLTPDLRNRVILDILSGLEAIHKAGYKHRDLKPQNVLVFDRYNAPRFALSDFGLMAPPDQVTTTLSATGAAGGSLNYASPESMKSFKLVTNRSDIYSVGAILHDLFVGIARVPCSRLTAPGLIGKVIEKCTEPNQSRRFSDVASLREAFVAAVSADPVAPLSSEDEVIVELLKADELTPDHWDQVDIRMQHNEMNSISNRAILQAIRSVHFPALAKVDAGLFNSISVFVVNEVFQRIGGYPFDYCDVLANKLESIFRNTEDIELRANTLLAILVLGTHHNRWYVERVFQRLSSPDQTAEIISRLITESEVRGIDLRMELACWSSSIGVSVSMLHPLLVDYSNV